MSCSPPPPFFVSEQILRPAIDRLFPASWLGTFVLPSGKLEKDAL